MLFVLLGLGAVLDPAPQELRPKVTGTIALVFAAANLQYQTKADFGSGLKRTSAVLVLASIVLIPLLWLVR
jgi:hypothetical protein